MMPNFIGEAVRTTPSDIARDAQAYGLEPALLLAVLEVETKGNGFDAMGRPTILFEPHLFYRELVDKFPTLLPDAVEHGLAYPRWGMRPYPANSYPRFAAACSLHVDAAIMSTSIGVGQIVGLHYDFLGFSHPIDMWNNALVSEFNQIHQILIFMSKSGALDYLRQKRFADFARIFNGGDFGRNHYDVKLEMAYERLNIKHASAPQ